MKKDSRVHRFVAEDFTFRASVVDATSVVEEMRVLQNAADVPARTLGRTMIGALLMASHLKAEQRVGIYVRGESPLESVFAEASFHGEVRAYTPHPEMKLDHDPGFAKGFLTVQRHSPFQQKPYNGTVELLTGDIQDDLMFYLKQSQQIRCLIEIDVHMKATGGVERAAGLLIEVMPGVESEVFQRIIGHSKDLPGVLSEMRSEKSPEEIIEPYFREMKFVEIDHPYPIKYCCRCTKERVKTTLAMLGAEEISTILEEAQPIDVRCQICGKPYHFDLEQISELLGSLDKDSMH